MRQRCSPSASGFKASMAFAIIFLAICSENALAAQTASSVNCQLRASPPPMATLGGPGTAAPGQTELAMAFGGHGEIFSAPCIHAGGLDWLARWRRGVSQRFDLGFDTVFDNQTDGSLGITAKAALRYRVNKGFRLEGGVGAADQGDGGSVNADAATVIGTSNPFKTWNYYSSLRLAGSRNCCTSAPGTRSPARGADSPGCHRRHRARV